MTYYVKNEQGDIIATSSNPLALVWYNTEIFETPYEIDYGPDGKFYIQDGTQPPPKPGDYYYWDSNLYQWVFSITPDEVDFEINKMKTNYYNARKAVQEGENQSLTGLRSLWTVSSMISSPNSAQVQNINTLYESEANSLKNALLQTDYDQQQIVNTRCDEIQITRLQIVSGPNIPVPNPKPACTLCAVPMNLVNVWGENAWDCPMCGRRVSINSALDIEAPASNSVDVCPCLGLETTESPDGNSQYKLFARKHNDGSIEITGWIANCGNSRVFINFPQNFNFLDANYSLFASCIDDNSKSDSLIHRESFGDITNTGFSIQCFKFDVINATISPDNSKYSVLFIGRWK